MTKLSNLVPFVLFAPAIVAAQEPVSMGSSAMWWFVALVAVGVIAVVFWRMRTMRTRRGPHGPQSPTPRGP